MSVNSCHNSGNSPTVGRQQPNRWATIVDKNQRMPRAHDDASISRHARYNTLAWSTRVTRVSTVTFKLWCGQLSDSAKQHTDIKTLPKNSI
jgi:hypothetical protein